VQPRNSEKTSVINLIVCRPQKHRPANTGSQQLEQIIGQQLIMGALLVETHHQWPTKKPFGFMTAVQQQQHGS